MDLSAVGEAALGAFLSGAVIALVGGAILHRRTQSITAEVQHAFETKILEYRSRREWQEQALSELLAPIFMQLERTKLAFHRWEEKNLHLEARIIKEGNQAIRDLLLSKGHLIPEELRIDAMDLINHYDIWLEKYEELRGAVNPKLDEPFVFVGTEGHPFPVVAEQHFRDAFRTLSDRLYGLSADQPPVDNVANLTPALH